MTAHTIINIPATDEAIRITPPGLHSGLDLTVQNVSDLATVYVGGEGVSSSDYGFKLLPGAAFSIELQSQDAVYVASVDNDARVSVLTFSLEN